MVYLLNYAKKVSLRKKKPVIYARKNLDYLNYKELIGKNLLFITF